MLNKKMKIKKRRILKLIGPKKTLTKNFTELLFLEQSLISQIFILKIKFNFFAQVLIYKTFRALLNLKTYKIFPYYVIYFALTLSSLCCIK